MSFPQLRVRTEFSFRKVFGPVADVARACAGLGAPLAAMVDSGTHGHVRWAAACKSVGITPAFGREVIVKTQDGRKPVCWVLAEDIKQFYHFSTALERIDCEIQIKELLRDHPGIIRFAGDALEDPALFDYVDINPSSIFAQRKARALAARTGKPLIHTSYNSYPLPEDAKVAAALGYGETAAGHLARPTDGHALGEIASRLATVLPVAPLIRVEGDFLGMVEAGRQRRLQLGHLKSWPQEYQQRLERELSVIAEKQFESYFIVVADMVMWAKERMLVGPARGSSAGSLVCYLLGITEVDPIFHGLLFERFIDLNRKDLPDIDVDFNDKKRDKVFAYLSEKYGRDNVARLGNVNTYKPRSLLAQVCKSFGIPDFERFNVINVLIEYSSGDSRYGKGLEDTFQNTEFGQNFNKKFPQAAEIAARIENHASHAGVHAAGVIVSNEPVSDYCTIGADGVAQLDKPDAEALNLLKIDALGLRTLGVIEDAGVVTTDRLYALQLNDPAVFEVFNQKKFSGIFQFEGQAQRSISAQVHVSDFMHIDHLTALARPGPLGGGAANKYINRHAGREQVEYDHPSLEPLTKDTYGLVLYQETLMSIVREIGNFSWEDTSFIRKAMSGRKGNEYFAKKKEQFIENAQRLMPREMAATIWDSLASFGSWGMNQNHTRSYAIISYWCAWMKVYHPLEYAAAALRNAKDDDQTVEILREITGEGVEYVPFDIDLSDVNWSVQAGKLVGGFTNLVGVGPAKANAAIAARAAGKLDRAKFAAMKCKFTELFPITRLYSDLYTNPEAHGCREGSKVLRGNELPVEGGDVLYIGRLSEKELRDENEAVRLQRRNGRRLSGNTKFLDLVCRDDTGIPIICRIDRFDFERIGRKAANVLQVGVDDLLVRGRRVPGFPMIKVDRFKVLNREV